MGATHALGGYEKTIVNLRRVLQPGGLMIIGEGFWQKKPEPDYLKLLGSSENDLQTHCENLLVAETVSMLPMLALTASTDEWDHYEWNYFAGIEEYFLKHPSHPQRQEFLDRISR